MVEDSERKDFEPIEILSFDLEHGETACKRKVRHATKAGARKARDVLRRSIPGSDWYACRFCKGFHISKLPVEDDRAQKRAARVTGDVVAIHYDPNPGVSLEIGDGLLTSTGRTYLIVGYRVQKAGKHAGRYHLLCAVNQPITGTTHPLVWYKRG